MTHKITAWASDGKRVVELESPINPSRLVDKMVEDKSGRERAAKHYERWSLAEDTYLETVALRRVPILQISKHLPGRTIPAITFRLRKIAKRIRAKRDLWA